MRYLKKIDSILQLLGSDSAIFSICQDKNYCKNFFNVLPDLKQEIATYLSYLFDEESDIAYELETADVDNLGIEIYIYDGIDVFPVLTECLKKTNKSNEFKNCVIENIEKEVKKKTIKEMIMRNII